MPDNKTVMFDAETHQLVPKQPTAEILAGAAVAVWPTASAADIALARDAALIAMKSMDAAPGVTLDMLAATIATMAPAYRAMLAAAPTPAAQSAGQQPVAARYIVIGYGESDYPVAAFANDADELLDAVLGVMYTKPADACDDTREEYRRALADGDEWCAEVWRKEFEIGGIVVYDTGERAAPVNGGEREHLNVLLERCAERLAEYGMQDCVRSVRGMKIPNDGSPVEHSADVQARGLGRRRCAADAPQVGAEYDGDSEQSRAAFRAYDDRVSVSARTPWQIWRDACAWQATQSAPKKADYDALSGVYRFPCGSVAPSPVPAKVGGATAFNPDLLDFVPTEDYQVADMANVGYTLLQRIAEMVPGCDWNESPTEIVSDLINERDEARAALSADGGQFPALTALLAAHASELESNAHAYFELAYTRHTEWMAWICSNSRESDPGRKVIARGQGATPEEACRAAIAANQTKGDAS